MFVLCSERDLFVWIRGNVCDWGNLCSGGSWFEKCENCCSTKIKYECFHLFSAVRLSISPLGSMLLSSCRPGPLLGRSVFCWAVWRDLTARHPWEKCPQLYVKGATMAGLEFDKPPHWNEMLKHENFHANYVFFFTKVMFNHVDINLVRCFLLLSFLWELQVLWAYQDCSDRMRKNPGLQALAGVSTIMNMNIFCMISTAWVVRKLLETIRGGIHVSVETESPT